MWGKSFIPKTLDLQLIKHWSKSCWSWLNDPRHWLRVALDLELTVRCKQQRPPPAGEGRSWRKLNGGVVYWGSVDCCAQSREKVWRLVLPCCHPSLDLLPKRGRNKKITRILRGKSASMCSAMKKGVCCLVLQPWQPMPHWQEADTCPLRCMLVALLAVFYSHLENTNPTCWVSMSDFVSGLN